MSGFVNLTVHNNIDSNAEPDHGLDIPMRLFCGKQAVPSVVTSRSHSRREAARINVVVWVL